jgi:5-methyltetrahydrofolate--homocysteine methyltransferase
MMLEGQGFEVIDLGVDADSDIVVDAIMNHHPEIVCLSALLSTTMTYQKEIIDAITQRGIRNQVEILVGGAPVTESYAKEIAADGYAPDAASAAELALRMVQRP